MYRSGCGPVSAASWLIARWHGRALGIPPEELFPLIHNAKTPRELWIYIALLPVFGIVCIGVADMVSIAGASGLLWIVEHVFAKTYAAGVHLGAFTDVIEDAIAGLVALLFCGAYVLFVLRRQAALMIATGQLSVCTKCGYPLYRSAKDAIRCPECGTLNDASKWLINQEGESGEGQDSA